MLKYNLIIGGHGGLQGLEKLFPLRVAEAGLRERLEHGHGADTVLSWIDENVSREVWGGPQFGPRLLHLLLDQLARHNRYSSASEPTPQVSALILSPLNAKINI